MASAGSLSSLAPDPTATDLSERPYAVVGPAYFAPFFAAFASFFACFFAALAAFFALEVAALSTPPWPEHALRPLVADGVPSLQIVVEVTGPWAVLTENATAAPTMAAVYKHFLNENKVPPSRAMIG
jgi:hypothetical protein